MIPLFLDSGRVTAEVSNHENGHLQPPNDLLESTIKHTFLISLWQQRIDPHNDPGAQDGSGVPVNILNRTFYLSVMIGANADCHANNFFMVRKWHNLRESSYP